MRLNNLLKRKIVKCLAILTILSIFINIDGTSMIVNAAPEQVIDLTNIFTGKESNHDCQKYLNKKYNSTSHWNECFVCNKKFNIQQHSFTTMGNDSCAWWNAGQTMICSCGYTKVYKKPHNVDHSRIVRYTNFTHYYYCSGCSSVTFNSIEPCKTADGQKISCKTGGGVCAKCGNVYTSNSHINWLTFGGTSGTTKCTECGTMFYTWRDNTYVKTGPNSVHCSIIITGWNKALWGTDINAVANGFKYISPGTGVLGTYSMTRKVINNEIYLDVDVTYPLNQDYSYTYAAGDWTFGPWSTRVYAAQGHPIEFEAPVQLSSSIAYGSRLRNYSTRATLSATFKDNWCYDPNVISFRVLDQNKNAISDWFSTVRSGSGDNKIYSQYVDLVAEIRDEQTCYIEVKDSGGNVAKYPISIINLDSKAPTDTTPTISKNWSKTKTVTFSCTDMGIGDVSIAFNSEDDYQPADKNGDTYSRTFTFTGDVYGDASVMVYYKDGVGNTSCKVYKISNLDNHEPTITDVSVVNNDSNWEFKVTGNDDYTGLSSVNNSLNTRGSGIGLYALSTDTVKPADTAFTKTITTDKAGSYYVWAMDNAGNVQMYPKQVETSYIIKFNGNKPKGASSDVYTDDGKGMSDVTANFSDKLKLPANKFKLAGWKFVGWNTEPDGTGIAYEDGSELQFITDKTNITLYAQWAIIYTVEHYKQNLDGTYTLADSDEHALVPLTQWTAPLYDYPGWDQPVSEAFTVGTTSTTVRLNYPLHHYTLTYDTQGGEWYEEQSDGTWVSVDAPPSEYTVLTPDIHVTKPDKVGYTFLGWTGTDVSSNTLDVVIPQGSLGDRSYTAHWEAQAYDIEIPTSILFSVGYDGRAVGVFSQSGNNNISSDGYMRNNSLFPVQVTSVTFDDVGDFAFTNDKTLDTAHQNIMNFRLDIQNGSEWNQYASDLLRGIDTSSSDIFWMTQNGKGSLKMNVDNAWVLHNTYDIKDPKQIGRIIWTFDVGHRYVTSRAIVNAE